MSNESGDVWIVDNGEIFNHARLRTDLEKAGHRYATQSDTETIIHFWEEYGPDSLERFIGFFAFALWDERRRTLFCARDRGDREVLVSMNDFFAALPKMIWHEDEPITFSSSVPLYFVSRLAAEQVKVVLTGEGSDELFAGYERYRYHLINERLSRGWILLPDRLRSASRRFLRSSRLLPASLRRKLLHTAVGRTASLEELYVDNRLRDSAGLVAAYIDLAALQKLLERNRAKEIEGTDQICRLLNSQLWGTFSSRAGEL